MVLVLFRWSPAFSFLLHCHCRRGLRPSLMMLLPKTSLLLQKSNTQTGWAWPCLLGKMNNGLIWPCVPASCVLWTVLFTHEAKAIMPASKANRLPAITAMGWTSMFSISVAAGEYPVSVSHHAWCPVSNHCQSGGDFCIIILYFNTPLLSCVRSILQMRM